LTDVTLRSFDQNRERQRPASFVKIVESLEKSEQIDRFADTVPMLKITPVSTTPNHFAARPATVSSQPPIAPSPKGPYILIPQNVFLPAIQASSLNILSIYQHVEAKERAPAKTWFKTNVVGGALGLAAWGVGFTFTGGWLMCAATLSGVYQYMFVKSQKHDELRKHVQEVAENFLKQAESLSRTHARPIPFTQQLSSTAAVEFTITCLQLTKQDLESLLWVGPLPDSLSSVAPKAMALEAHIRTNILREAFPTLFSNRI
jgi:hypothetical protein